ncbi:PREDICTED: uncharacterized protein CXorf65 homolog [Acropora digitifera]|uniref:uncharacterized protein CXorf65 homolog n=1 Tax=Acropora digitifera TaxID=70779 RepID=UPI00077A69B4|nr:PREDICTED: uncharacterized protein CXorf65 homolog [Acropora digitifera]
MFITVRFGDCQEALFNPNCIIKVLLEDIKKRCRRNREELIDLSDESGNLKNLLDHKTEYATDLLKARHSFILIRLEKKQGEELFTYTPLLNDIRTITSTFLQHLTRPQSSQSSVSPPSRQGRRKSSANWTKARTSLALSGELKKRARVKKS